MSLTPQSWIGTRFLLQLGTSVACIRSMALDKQSEYKRAGVQWQMEEETNERLHMVPPLCLSRLS